MCSLAGRGHFQEQLPNCLTHGSRTLSKAYMNWLYATGTSSARYAIERHQWSEAANLMVPPNTFPRERYSWTEANLHFARALGATHGGGVESARKDLQRLAEIQKILAQENNK